jgi:iron(III) transport system substrate-binding protein
MSKIDRLPLSLAIATLVFALSMGAAYAQASPDPTESASPPSGALTVYSGRSQELVGPLLERFADETGIPVNLRYGESAELAALLLEEGDRSPADVFFAQDAGALGAVAAAGLFTTLDPGTVSRVETRFRDPQGRWTGTSGRARVAAWSTERLAASELPGSILAFTDPAWTGRLGWVPTNASFQAFVTALRILEGEAAARAWLEGILANGPVVFDGNTSAVEGVAAGEADVAFVNHYYLLELVAEHGPDFPVANHFFEAGDPGSLVNVAGVGILASSTQPELAQRLVEWLLGDAAQTYFRDRTFEYPLAGDLGADPRLPPLASIGSPDIDLGRLADLRATVDLLRDVGALD